MLDPRSLSECRDLFAEARRRRGTPGDLGAAVAMPRTSVALLENHQRADGSVGVPRALRPNVGFDSIGPR